MIPELYIFQLVLIGNLFSRVGWDIIFNTIICPNTNPNCFFHRVRDTNIHYTYPKEIRNHIADLLRLPDDKMNTCWMATVQSAVNYYLVLNFPNELKTPINKAVILEIAKFLAKRKRQ